MDNFDFSDDHFPLLPGGLFSPGSMDVPVLPLSPMEPSRKRAREPSPDPQPQAPAEDNATEIAIKLRSNNPDDIVMTLNFLLKASSDTEMNYQLGRGGEEVIEALVELFDDTIGWSKGNSTWNKDDDKENDSMKPSNQTWESNVSPSSIGAKSLGSLDCWETFCAVRFAPSTVNTVMNPSHIYPPHLLNEESDHDSLKVLEMIIMIVRNLSYVQGNVRFIIYSIGMIRILVGALYFRNFSTSKTERALKENEIETGNSTNNMCLHAIHTFNNLAPNLDISGRKLFLDLHFLDADIDVTESKTKAARYADYVDVKSYVNGDKCGLIQKMGVSGLKIARNYNTKDETLENMDDNILRPFVKDNVRATLRIFAPIFSLLRVRSSRAVVVSTLELLMVFLDNPDLNDVFLHISDQMLFQLIHLLWIPRLGRDALEYVDPVYNSVPRVSTMKLLGGYDVSVDYEIRDRSIEILQKVTGLSDDLKRRFGRRMIVTQSDKFELCSVKITDQLNTRLYDALIPALTSKVGREHTPNFAASLLANLASIDDNLPGLLYAERRILRAASSLSSESAVSKILFNDVLGRL